MELNGLLDGTTVAPLEHHTTIAFAKNQKKVFVCDNEENFTVTSYKLDVDEKVWKRERFLRITQRGSQCWNCLRMSSG